jgi:signal transduction histidine kinase
MLALLTALLGVAFTAFVYLLPGFDVAFRSGLLHAGGEAVAAVAAVAAACVLLVRAGTGPRVYERLTACALLVCAVENVGFLVIPTADAYGRVSAFSTWSSALAGVLAGALFLAAIPAGQRSVRGGRRTAAAVTVVGAAAVCAGIALPVAAFGRGLPLAIEQEVSPVGPGAALPAGAASMAALMLLAALLFAAAAWRVVVSPLSAEGALARWLAVALVAFSFAAINFAVFPSLYSSWVFAGDIAQFVGWTAVLAGVVAEVGHYRRQLVAGAVLEERRRMARDLHDGLAQELAFMALQLTEIKGRASERPALRRVGEACDRAIEQARAAIVALTEPIDAQALGALRRAAEEFASTHPTVRLDVVGADLETTPAEREVLTRIAREAITNALRHGYPKAVRLRLAEGPRRVLRVVDDGTGFSRDEQTLGFGLISMRERAAAAGGDVVVRSIPGLGTAVELRLPTPARKR